MQVPSFEEVGRPQCEAIEQVLDAPEIRRARTSHDAGDLIPFVEQQLGKI